MNYLAHLHLAHISGQSLQGALLGDEVKGYDWQLYPSELASAIRQHRAIDRFTDNHPFIRSLSASFPQGQRRFAGIVLDLACDYWLTHAWPHLESTPRPTLLEHIEYQLDYESRHYALYCYAGLDRYRHRIRSMVKEHWLAGYGEPENLHHALSGIERRLRRPIQLRPLLAKLPHRADGFVEFYRELKAFAIHWQCDTTSLP